MFYSLHPAHHRRYHYSKIVFVRNRVMNSIQPGKVFSKFELSLEIEIMTTQRNVERVNVEDLMEAAIQTCFLN